MSDMNGPRDDSHGLPRDLGDGLVVRWATPSEAAAVAAFDQRLLADDPEEGELLARWTGELMGGKHPTTSAGDFTVVVDESTGGSIVSSMVLISQTWSYDGIPFGVGRPELVATDPTYRRKGLVRAQFDAIHAKSAGRGELVQGITGIPWFYRQFGYEMALDLGGHRRLPQARLTNFAAGQPPTYRLRPATLDDLPLLVQLYDIHRRSSQVTRERTEREWRWELHVDHRDAIFQEFHIVVDVDGAPIGYIGLHRTSILAVEELAVLPGYSLRDVCISLGQALHAIVEQFNQDRAVPFDGVLFRLGTTHPAYVALGSLLNELDAPYAWYLRVPDLPAFLRHVAPVLERRLAASVMSGYSGTLRLNFYRSRLTLVFDRGALVDIGSFEPMHLADGDACFPDLTFLHLIFGHRSLAELKHAFPDCSTRDEESALLLDILFPARPSHVCPLA